jgi:hypothetical protein
MLQIAGFCAKSLLGSKLPKIRGYSAQGISKSFEIFIKNIPTSKGESIAALATLKINPINSQKRLASEDLSRIEAIMRNRIEDFANQHDLSKVTHCHHLIAPRDLAELSFLNDAYISKITFYRELA